MWFTITTVNTMFFQLSRSDGNCQCIFLFSQNESTEPDLNQRPRDIWFCIQSTVSRSTNWAIGGDVFEIKMRPYLHQFASYRTFDMALKYSISHSPYNMVFNMRFYQGGLAQVVERSICIREAPVSIPGFSTFRFSVENVKERAFCVYIFYRKLRIRVSIRVPLEWKISTEG